MSEMLNTSWPTTTIHTIPLTTLPTQTSKLFNLPDELLLCLLDLVDLKTISKLRLASRTTRGLVDSRIEYHSGFRHRLTQSKCMRIYEPPTGTPSDENSYQWLHRIAWTNFAEYLARLQTNSPGSKSQCRLSQAYNPKRDTLTSYLVGGIKLWSKVSKMLNNVILALSYVESSPCLKCEVAKGARPSYQPFFKCDDDYHIEIQAYDSNIKHVNRIIKTTARRREGAARRLSLLQEQQQVGGCLHNATKWEDYLRRKESIECKEIIQIANSEIRHATIQEKQLCRPERALRTDAPSRRDEATQIFEAHMIQLYQAVYLDVTPGERFALGDIMKIILGHHLQFPVRLPDPSVPESRTDIARNLPMRSSSSSNCVHHTDSLLLRALDGDEGLYNALSLEDMSLWYLLENGPVTCWKKWCPSLEDVCLPINTSRHVLELGGLLYSERAHTPVKEYLLRWYVVNDLAKVCAWSSDLRGHESKNYTE